MSERKLCPIRHCKENAEPYCWEAECAWWTIEDSDNDEANPIEHCAIAAIPQHPFVIMDIANS